MASKLVLNEADLIGKGAHKATYFYPGEKGKCVKIPYETPDVDVKKELLYRKILTLRGKKLGILTEYFGVVETSMGTGYCFEVLLDADGRVSQSLKSVISKIDPKSEKQLAELHHVLLGFKKDYWQSKVITSDMDPENFFVQVDAEGKKRVRIIDNIGTPVAIPAMYFFDFLAAMHNKKYWKRFIREQQERYPQIFTSAFCAELF